MQYLDCAYVSVLEDYRGPRKSGHIVHILHIFYFLIVDRPQPGWISVNLQSSSSAVNKHKSCMWFQYPPYWDAFLWFQWARPGQYPSPCDENRLTLMVLSVTNRKTVVMVVDGGTWTAGPWDGERSNSCNKQCRPGERHFKLSKSICIFIMYMQNMHNNMQIYMKIICNICQNM